MLPNIKCHNRKFYTVISIFILLMGLCNRNAFSQDKISKPDDKPTFIFNAGNEAYRSGEFKKSEKLYKEAISTGMENTKLYYNLGNAYFRQKKWGYARLYYEKALYLMPRDEDIKKNLGLVLKLLEDKPAPLTTSFITLVYRKFLELFSLSEWIWWFDGIYFFLSGFFMFKLLFKRDILAVRISFFCSVLLFLVAIVGMGGKMVKHWDSKGIILQKKVEVKSAPQLTYPTIFNVHLGTKVSVVKKRKDWVFIKFSNKLSGWVPQKSMGII